MSVARHTYFTPHEWETLVNDLFPIDVLPRETRAVCELIAAEQHVPVSAVFGMLIPVVQALCGAWNVSNSTFSFMVGLKSALSSTNTC
jgi:hypothetical protein